MAEHKIVLLHKIRQEKEILFGAFSRSLTKYDKIRKWKEIAYLAESLGILNGKPWAYLRDTVWPNWRKRTLAKRMRFLSTSYNKGRAPKLTDVDFLVLDILGKESPSVQALADTLAVSQEDEFMSKEVPESEFISKEEPEDEFIGMEVPIFNQKILKNFVNTEDSSPNDTLKGSKEDVSPDLRMMSKDEKLAKKLDLELENLELQNYILKLQALELEQKLGLQRSTYTSVLPSVCKVLSEIEN